MEDNAPKDCCKLLVGTKLDCESERAVNRKDAENLAIKIGVNYLECSSKTG
jgi:Ras-related protein Rab-18